MVSDDNKDNNDDACHYTKPIHEASAQSTLALLVLLIGNHIKR